MDNSKFDRISQLSLYDKTTHELYTFENKATMDAFISSQSLVGAIKESYSPSERRSVVEKVYTKIHTSKHQITTVNGGPRGATMSLSHSVSVSVEGLTSSVSGGVSYPVPKNKRGTIVVKTKMQYTKYRVESRMNTGYKNRLNGYMLGHILSKK